MDASLPRALRRLAGQGVIYGLGSALGSFLSFALIPLYTRELSPAEYGVLGLLAAVSNVGAVVFGIGMTRALFRSYYDYKSQDEQDRVISTAFLILLGSGLALACVTALFAPSISTLVFGSTIYADLIQIAMMSSTFLLLKGIPAAIFRIENRAWLYVFLELTFLVVGVIANVGLVVVLRWGVSGAVLGRLVMTSFSCLAATAVIHSRIHLQFSSFDARKMFAFGFPLVFSGLSAAVYNTSSRFFLNSYISLDEVGIYNLAYQIAFVVTILFGKPVKLVWGPAFLAAHRDMQPKDATRFYGLGLTYGTLAASTLLLGLLLLGPDVLSLMVNERYRSAFSLVPILATGLAIWGCVPVINVAVSIKRKTTFIALNFAFGALIHLALNFLLIPTFGGLGAAWSSLASFLVMTVVALFYNHRLQPVPYEWWRIVRIVTIAAVLIGVGGLVDSTDLRVALALRVLLVLAFPVLLVLAKVPSREESARFRVLLDRALRRRTD